MRLTRAALSRPTFDIRLTIKLDNNLRYETRIFMNVDHIIVTIPVQLMKLLLHYIDCTCVREAMLALKLLFLEAKKCTTSRQRNHFEVKCEQFTESFENNS